MKGYNSETYSEGTAKTGLVLALVDPVTRELIDWSTFPPLAANEIEWPKGYAPHYGVHQFDVVETNHPNVTGEAA